MGGEGARGRRRDRRRRPRRRPAVFCYAQDPSYLGGSLGEQHADSIIRVLRLAGRAGAPVVGFIESGGARMQEGLAALGGYGRIFREHVALSGRIPQISVICGASAGGGSYSPALTDFVVMTERATMFLTGPAVVREVMGEDVSAAELGGPKVHERNGVAHFVAKTDERRGAARRATCSTTCRPARERAPAALALGRARAAATPADAVPDDERRVYDVRDVIARPRRRRPPARVVAALGAQHRLRLRPPRGPRGRRDRQPAALPRRRARRRLRRRRARASCAPATRSGCRSSCSSTRPGFMPGTQQEQGGVIRHGAKLVHAFAEAERAEGHASCCARRSAARSSP